VLYVTHLSPTPIHMIILSRTTCRVMVALALLGGTPTGADAAQQTRNVFVVTMDGLRWQEVFGGAQADIALHAGGGVRDTAALARRYLLSSDVERRAALMPFLWTTIATQGQILGDSTHGSVVRVTNGLRFSYPGYNEILTGVADPRITSNDKIPNPNVTVLEWLNGQRAFRGRVAAYGSWNVLPFILNVERSGLYANGDGPPISEPRTERERLLNEFAADMPRLWEGARLDAATMQGSLEYLRANQPRVLYVMLGETDEWAHERRYDLYLDAARRGDDFLRRLWHTAQAMPQYRGATSLLVTTDHGRGLTADDWTSHGERIPAAERIWIAVLGPDTPALGVRDGVRGTQSQVAATVALLLGEDYLAAAPSAAPPLPGVVAR